MNPGDRIQTTRELATLSGSPIPAGALGVYLKPDIEGLHVLRLDHYKAFVTCRETTDFVPAPSGLRASRVNRRTGDRISVYDGIPQQMDTSAGRWQTVCEAHGTIISSETLALAQAAMTCPDDWCEDCAVSLRDS